MNATLKSLGFRFVGSAVLVATAAQATQAACTNTNTIADGALCSQPTGTPATIQNTFSTIANTLIFIVGAVAVIMLVIGGLRYALSAGDSSAVKGAKDTILYALIGVIVAVIAFAAVNFVITRFH